MKSELSIIKNKKKIYFLGIPLLKISHREGNGTFFTVIELLGVPFLHKREFKKDNNLVTKIALFSFNIFKIVRQKK